MAGRPRGFEQRRRQREFWRQLAATGSFERSAKAAGLSAAQTLRLLDDPQALLAAIALADRAQGAA
jgi:hypothetical protein